MKISSNGIVKPLENREEQLNMTEKRFLIFTAVIYFFLLLLTNSIYFPYKVVRQCLYLSSSWNT